MKPPTIVAHLVTACGAEHRPIALPNVREYVELPIRQTGSPWSIRDTLTPVTIRTRRFRIERALPEHDNVRERHYEYHEVVE